MRRRTKAERQAWWASLTPEEQDAYIERVKARKGESPAAREASARLDLAEERHCFMADVPDEDVAVRLTEMFKWPFE
jgi:predicted Fe-S protein YdhL (DUF1289 family)